MAAAKPMDVVLLMDSSGSMKKTDPNFLRNPAAKLFISLLGDEDRVSVVSFSDNGYPVSYLSSAKNIGSQQRHFAAVDKISTKGAYTNIPAALDTAMKVYRRNAKPDRQLHLILMTDGKIDVGSEKRNQALKQDLMSRIIPAMIKHGIRLHGIAFTHKSDIELLKQLSQKTGGNFYLANSDKDLHGVYTAIFENTKTPNQVPFKGDRFVIDSSISEATVIGTKSGSKKLSLVAPDGKHFTAATAPASVKWMETPQFDLITIKTPQPGEWQLASSDGHNKAYVITNLELKTEFQPSRPEVGDGVMIKSWLEEKSKKLTKEEIISNLSVKINVNTPEGNTHHLQMEPYANYDASADSKGIFASYIAFPSKGNFQLNIQFDGKTFSRKAQLSIPVGVEAAPASGDPLTQAVAEVVSNDNGKIATPESKLANHVALPSLPNAVVDAAPAMPTQVSDSRLPQPVADSATAAPNQDVAAINAPTAQGNEAAGHIAAPANDGNEPAPSTATVDSQAASHATATAASASASATGHAGEIALPSEGALAADATASENSVTTAAAAAASDSPSADDKQANKGDKESAPTKKSKNGGNKKTSHGKEPANAKSDNHERDAVSPLTMAIFVFIGINALLALIGGGAYWYLKRKKPSSSEEDDSSDNNRNEKPAIARKEPQISSKAA